ncbi:putative bifunctional diguanylate cyclase/phosphodiesterase [Legionella tunisiensis]|uniref:putative bifunctional diguanylate cyclase/phosphodiesterase n=1 Tax=Legionella tunisiensis TaxID=1034944 RepID=UPI0002FFAF6D|nr:GGDEF domain-containing phosphodiesterase [Legionella tunisiensis]
MGISYYPYDGKNAEVLLENAESVMVSAKSRGHGNDFLFYSDEIHTNITKLLELTTDLQNALKQHEFFLLYQPIVNLKNGRIHGVEALIRWNHPKHGLISPDVFIPLAEKSELINAIGDWVLRTACLQHQEWMKKGLPRLWMAVNFSNEQFKQHDLDEKIRQILKETKMNPNCLEIEMTERDFIDTNNIMLNKFLKITNQGVKLAVDDFGTGYSNFTYLKEFPIHTLKIDQSFIKNIDFDPENAAIVNAMISMAKTLKIKVIVEGIENEGQLRILKQTQCDEGQGYYFSKPIDAEAIAKILQEKHNGSEAELSFNVGCVLT